MKMILNSFRKGTLHHIKMQDNGLIYAGEPGKALTWMDAIVNGKPVTPRTGLQVEINALWYNAISFCLELAREAGDEKFIREWEPVAKMLPDAFINTFWDEEKGYLADFVNGDRKDWSVRPNMVFAVSMPYSMLDDGKMMSILEVVKNELLTPRGLRTLSPKNTFYKGKYYGNQKTRDEAYHQGTVWPWLFGHFAEGYLKLYKESGKEYIRAIYEGFEEVMSEHGIGTISEVYDGDPPHTAGGTISQAWSVAELLRTGQMIGKIE